MENVGYAALQVIPSLKGFDSSLERGTAAPLSRAGDLGGRRFGSAAGKSAAVGMRDHLKSAAAFIIGGFVGAEAIRKTGDIIRDSLDEARDSQRVSAVTEARIRSTGGAANLTAKQIGKLSTALSNKVGIDDETIQRGANMLLTFKNIRDGAGKTSKVFTQATAITTDLASSMAGNNGGEPDLKSASILVGKALNDPTKGLTALTRVGVTFSDQQKKQIENFVKQGDTAKAQKVILQELNSEFGGTAAAQATVSEKLTVAWKNTEEELGNKLLPLVHDFQSFLLKKGVPAAQDFVQWFGKKGVPLIHSFVHEAKPLATSLLPAVGTGFKDIGHFLKQAAPAAKATIDAFNSLPDWAQKSIVIGGAAGLVAKKTGVLSFGKQALAGGGGGGVLGLVSKAKPLPVFVVNNGVDVPGVAGGKGSKTIGEELGAVAKRGGPLAFVPQAAVLGGALYLDAKGAKYAYDSTVKSSSQFVGGRAAPTLGGPSSGNHINFGKLAMDANGFFVSTAKKSDALKASLSGASQALDLVSRRGSATFGGLSSDIGGATTRTDILEGRLKAFPKRLRTELDLDTSAAERNLATLRAHAGRHLSASLSIELAGRGPAQRALDGVRR